MVCHRLLHVVHRCNQPGHLIVESRRFLRRPLTSLSRLSVWLSTCVRQFVPSLQDCPQLFAVALELASELGVSLLGLSGSSSCGSREHEFWLTCHSLLLDSREVETRIWPSSPPTSVRCQQPQSVTRKHRERNLDSSDHKTLEPQTTPPLRHCRLA